MNKISSTVGLQVPEPPTPVNVDGTPLLVYELHIVNFVPRDLTVQRVVG